MYKPGDKFKYTKEIKTGYYANNFILGEIYIAEIYEQELLGVIVTALIIDTIIIQFNTETNLNALGSTHWMDYFTPVNNLKLRRKVASCSK